MQMTVAFVCVALALHSPLIFKSAAAVSPSQDTDHVIPPHSSAFDPCTNINDLSKKEEKDVADKICRQAFLTLDQNNANSCRGWRQPECRLVSGFSFRQCSCVISVCNQSGISSDETKSFRGCALDLWIDRYFTGQAVAPSGFKDLFKSVERSAIVARARTLYSSLLRARLSAAGTSFTPHTAHSGNVAEGAASQYGAGTSRKGAAGAGGKIFTCDVCQNDYKSVVALHDHKKSHKELLACNLCKRTYATASNLRSHIKQKHEGKEAEASLKHPNLIEEIKKANAARKASKTFVCAVCGAAYAWQKSLRGHLKSHEPHATICILCNRSYSNPSNLLAHMRDVHQPSTDKPHENTR